MVHNSCVLQGLIKLCVGIFTLETRHILVPFYPLYPDSDNKPCDFLHDSFPLYRLMTL